MFVSEVEAERHLVLEHDWFWLRWLRRETDNPKLFVLRDFEHGHFLLCHWCEMGKLFVALEQFEGSPTATWPEGLMVPEALKVRCAMVGPDTKKRLNGRDAWMRDKTARRDERLRERADACRWMRKKGLDDVAHKVETGRMPWVPPSEVSDTTRQAVKEMVASMK